MSSFFCIEKRARKIADRKNLSAFERGRKGVFWTSVCRSENWLKGMGVCGNRNQTYFEFLKAMDEILDFVLSHSRCKQCQQMSHFASDIGFFSYNCKISCYSHGHTYVLTGLYAVFHIKLSVIYNLQGYRLTELFIYVALVGNPETHQETAAWLV